MTTPSFIERDPATIEAAAKTAYEAALGKTLQPGQAERLLLNANVYRELLVRIGVQSAALQNLVNFASGSNLDQLGALLTTTRLAAQAATCIVQFTRSVTTSQLIIPSGTRVGASGSNIRFALDEDLVIPSGQTSGAGKCTATTTGTDGNGFAIGALTTLIDAVQGATLTVANTTESSGGAAIEVDDRYRERIKLAPEKFSVAGSQGAYRFWALSADSTITDVSVLVDRTAVTVQADPWASGSLPASGFLGDDDIRAAFEAALTADGVPDGTVHLGALMPNLTVNVYPLTTTGLPSANILTSVFNALNASTVRPLTDIVSVLSPAEVNYAIAANITLYETADQASLQDDLDAAAQAYADTQSATLGRDIVRSQLIAALSLNGVYNVELTSPAADIALTPNQWPSVTGITVNITGTAEG